MRSTVYLIVLSGLCLVFSTTDCKAGTGGYWNLPAAVSDSNIKITFEVDTTWHVVHGTTKGISGMIWLDDPKDYKSIRAEIHVPVATLDTDNESRDKNLHRIMNPSNSPEVLYTITNVASICSPDELNASGECKGLLNGTLTIKNLTREIRIPFTLRKINEEYSISGEIKFSWKAFEVEDPSIVIAKVNEDVLVKFDGILRKF